MTLFWAYVMWIVIGAVYMVCDMQHQFKMNDGTAEPTPRFWWEWPIELGLLSFICGLLIIWLCCIGVLYCLSFGRIDIDF